MNYFKVFQFAAKVKRNGYTVVENWERIPEKVGKKKNVRYLMTASWIQ